MSKAVKPKRAGRGSKRLAGVVKPGDLPRWWKAYFAALSKTGVKAKASAIVKIDRTTPNRYIETHPELADRFAEEEREALVAAAELLETEARRRAVDGVSEPIFYRGRRIATMRRYSDTLLMFLLNGAMPEKYKYRGEVRHTVVDLNALTVEQRERLFNGETLQAVLGAG